MRYRVKLSYPTILVIGQDEHRLFPGQEVELPETEVVKTFEGLGYLEPLPEVKPKTTKKEGSDAS
jgi:hypothetical protein